MEPNEAAEAGPAPARVVEAPAPQPDDPGAGGEAANAERTGPADAEAARSRETPTGPPVEAGADGPAESAEPPAAGREARLAEAALDAIAESSGEAIAQAAAEGRLFAEHGREIMAAFDEWRREAGRDADPAVFRAALRARWGVDLA